MTVNPKLSGRPWNLNLHKVIGAYAGLVLLVSALTGLPIAFDSVKAALYPLTGSTKEEPPMAARPAAAPFVGFDAVARELERLMPAAQETYIPLPEKGPVAAYAIAANAPHPVARSYAWIDGATGKVLRHQPFATAPRGFRLYYWMMALHLGYVGGWAAKIVLLLGALAVPVLGWTGVASYLRRKSRKNAPVAARAVNPDPVFAK